ncbi:MAG: TerB family tellurite resistance protein [Coriobacteriales bacterium]
MAGYFKTVGKATREVFSALGKAASVIGPATVEATKETVTKINEFSDNANAKMQEWGLDFQSSADVPLDVPTASEDDAGAIPVEAQVEPAESVAELPAGDATASYAYAIALTAILSYVARCDDQVAEGELELLNNNLSMYISNPDVPAEVAEKLQELASDDTLEFADVAEYLDGVAFKSLASLEKIIQSMIDADGVTSPKEARVQERFARYLESRRNQEA